ncbi:hypothetical protein [Mesotoga sp. UBA5847]|jgi:hypothetical protein|uniref:hypothetical protein n=1 Tax=Mesotoga sp. UBA5847 TaxID=1946859 RepID=UPI0025F9D998|nr:hypothetical protein [Mesotoga sp. UBA5847]
MARAERARRTVPRTFKSINPFVLGRAGRGERKREREREGERTRKTVQTSSLLRRK